MGQRERERERERERAEQKTRGFFSSATPLRRGEAPPLGRVWGGAPSWMLTCVTPVDDENVTTVSADRAITEVTLCWASVRHSEAKRPPATRFTPCPQSTPTPSRPPALPA